jgi:PAS domain S-box-containing protein
MIEPCVVVAPATQRINSAMKLAFLHHRAPQQKRDELGMRRLAAVAELGQRALAIRDVPTLMDNAVTLVARTVAADYCSVLQLLPQRTDLRFIAGVGWPDGIVGHAIVPGGLRSQAGYTLMSGASVVMEDLRTETRFEGNRLLHEQGIISGVSVIIAGNEQPFGILSLHTRQPRRFSTADIHFLESVANVLASAIERTQVDARLHEKELQYRAIFEATGDGLAITDLDGWIVEANPAYCAMRGYGYEELIGMNVRDLIHAPDHRVLDAYLHEIRAGRTFQGRATLLRKDGSTFPGEVHGSGFLYMGKPHALSVVRDVTERVQAEERLRQQEAQYRSIFEATTDGLAILDHNGIIVEANPALCHMHKYRYEQVIGQPAAMLLHPDQHAHLATNMRSVTAGGTSRRQAVDVCSDGTLIHVEVRGSTFLHHGQLHVLAVVQDITERVQAEQELREREAQYRSIFEATSDGLVIIDLHGMIVEINPAFCAMLGYTYDELIGEQYATLFHPDAYGQAAEAFATILAGGVVQTRSLLMHKNGTPIHVEGYGSSFAYMGKPHLLGVSHNITERVQAYELLEQRVAERTRELSAILEVSRNVASTLELAPLLRLILEQLKIVVDYTGAAIFIVEEAHVRVLDYRGPLPPDQILDLRIPLTQALGYRAVSHEKGPVIVDDQWAAHPLARVVGDLRTYFQGWVAYARSWLVVPLMVQDRVIGVVRIDHAAERAYTPHHATLAMAFATQVAVMIEHARLYERAQHAAALEERHRLARELHDSVTQALYGVTMYAEAAAALLTSGDQTTAAQYLHVLRDTAQDALREMRLLIFELRPPVLEQAGLVAALQERLAAVEGRVGGLTTTLDVRGNPDLPAAVEQAFYGIAQESLNNVFKHANARTVALTLRQDATMALLEIVDDGIGFDPAMRARKGGLGVRGMEERAAQVGGRLIVQSAPGQGTRVRVEIPI